MLWHPAYPGSAMGHGKVLSSEYLPGQHVFPEHVAPPLRGQRTDWTSHLWLLVAVGQGKVRPPEALVPGQQSLPEHRWPLPAQVDDRPRLGMTVVSHLSKPGSAMGQGKVMSPDAAERGQQVFPEHLLSLPGHRTVAMSQVPWSLAVGQGKLRPREASMPGQQELGVQASLLPGQTDCRGLGMMVVSQLPKPGSARGQGKDLSPEAAERGQQVFPLQWLSLPGQRTVSTSQAS